MNLQKASTSHRQGENEVTESESPHLKVQNTQKPSPLSMIPNCPLGLENLLDLDKLFIHQKAEIWEAGIIGFETRNKYEIFNNREQKVFYALEDSHRCTQNCCRQIRPFRMSITDDSGNEVIHFERSLACDMCCFPCCLQKLKVFAPPGSLMGTIRQEWSLWKPHFSIRNSEGDTVLLIEGPVCTIGCCRRPVTFRVLELDGVTEVGEVTKEWGGILREIFIDADFLGISFPVDLDVRIKAVMLGACFLIDFMYFENAPGMMMHA